MQGGHSARALDGTTSSQQSRSQPLSSVSFPASGTTSDLPDWHLTRSASAIARIRGLRICALMLFKLQ